MFTELTVFPQEKLGARDKYPSHLINELFRQKLQYYNKENLYFNLNYITNMILYFSNAIRAVDPSTTNVIRHAPERIR